MDWLRLFLSCVLVSGICECNQSFKKDIFNTKTPYFWVRSKSDVIQENAFSTFNHNSKTCSLKGINILFRHGSRYPTLKWIKRISGLLSALKEQNDIVTKHSFLKQYNNPFRENQEGLLSTLGENEMVELGQRFGKRLKSTLENRINKVQYFVSRKARTQSSYDNFYKGLNNTFPTPGEAPSATVDNKKIRFYDFCSKYIDEVEDEDDAFKERDDFEDGREINTVVQKVRNKLGGSNNSIDFDKVKVMHQLCAFELGLEGASEWCKFFEMDDLRIIAYLNDLEDYVEGGYGYPITSQQTCPYTSYLFERFDDVIDDGTTRPASIDIFFGHSETIVPIYTAFGLFKDSKSYTAENYAKNADRLFSTSKIAPFSANIAVGLYKCEEMVEFLVKFYVNEEPIAIPACGQKVCSYSDVKKYYNDLVECDFDDICDTDSVAALQYSVTISLLCFIVTILL